MDFGATEMGKIHIYILFTQSRGYSDIKICSSYKINFIHLKPTVLISQICLKTICIHDWKFYLVT